jgi:hypothetical protein
MVRHARIRSVHLSLLTLALLSAALVPTGSAHAGVYEYVTGKKLIGKDADATPVADPEAAPDADAWLKRPDAKTKYFDHRFEPFVLGRVLFVNTFNRDYCFNSTTNATENALSVGTAAAPAGCPAGFTPNNTSNLQPGIFGNRQGFVVQNAEFGAYGRFNGPGLSWRMSFELNPLSKDGNPLPQDNLRDMFIQWDKYKFFSVKAGNQRSLFSQANNWSTANQRLIYKPVMDTLVLAQRQTGVVVAGGDPWQAITLSGGVFSGTRTVAQPMTDLNQMVFVGRGDFRVDNLVTAIIGSDSWKGVSEFEMNIAGNVSINPSNFDQVAFEKNNPALRAALQDRLVGGDARIKTRWISIEGEYILRDYELAGNADPNLISTAYRGYAWHVDITGHIIPGVLDATVRVEEQDGNIDLANGDTPGSNNGDQLRDQAKRWYTGGLRLNVTDQLRLDLNYIHRVQLEGIPWDNHAVIGMIQVNI